MTLRITLEAGEQIIVNGAMRRAVGRTSLSLESNHACVSAYTDPIEVPGHPDRALSDCRTLMAIELAAFPRDGAAA